MQGINIRPSVGDTVIVRGTATDRWTANADDVVDRLEYRIDSGPWHELTLSGIDWSFPFNTTQVPDGDHTITIRGTEGLDQSTRTLLLKVENGALGPIRLQNSIPRYAQLQATGDEDTYRYEVPLGVGRWLVAVSEGPPDANFDLEVSNGILAWTSTGPTSSETVTVTQATPGSYTVRIWSVQGAGEYKLTVEEIIT